jgi:putative (di)nucleoside polyphosphate hydrolase
MQDSLGLTESPRLRPNVALLILNRKRELFLGERLDEPGHWQFPQGGDPTSCRLVGYLSIVNQYLWSEDRKRGLCDAELRPYVGQSQKFCVILFQGEDSEIRLDRHLPIEFQQWRWCPRDEVISLTSIVRRSGYERALEELELRIHEWGL